ncbi:MAG: hypothetical protein PHX21_03990 [bacterium]|nr:hypothetical protein [bacterium]
MIDEKIQKILLEEISVPDNIDYLKKEGCIEYREENLTVTEKGKDYLKKLQEGEPKVEPKVEPKKGLPGGVSLGGGTRRFDLQKRRQEIAKDK